MNHDLYDYLSHTLLFSDRCASLVSLFTSADTNMRAANPKKQPPSPMMQHHQQQQQRRFEPQIHDGYEKTAGTVQLDQILSKICKFMIIFSTKCSSTISWHSPSSTSSRSIQITVTGAAAIAEVECCRYPTQIRTATVSSSDCQSSVDRHAPDLSSRVDHSTTHLTTETTTITIWAVNSQSAIDRSTATRRRFYRRS